VYPMPKVVHLTPLVLYPMPKDNDSVPNANKGVPNDKKVFLMPHSPDPRAPSESMLYQHKIEHFVNNPQIKP
jgi:hypothetical protein